VADDDPWDLQAGHGSRELMEGNTFAGRYNHPGGLVLSSVHEEILPSAHKCESSPNRLAYPDSIYANLRAGMPDSVFASESTFASSATSSLSARSSSTTTSTVTLTTTMTTGTGTLTTTNTTPSQCTFSTVTVFVS
jgi:hypothetical protein